MKHSLKRSGRHWVPAARQQSSFWQLFSLIEAERATVRWLFHLRPPGMCSSKWTRPLFLDPEILLATLHQLDTCLVAR
jgi:hypothetical protein